MEAVRTAHRTRRIVAHTIGVTDIIDPLGGAYAVEAIGGMVEAVKRKLQTVFGAPTETAVF